MPGDTKIKRNAQGWYDVDQPGVYYPARRFARDARRGTPITTTTNPSVTLTLPDPAVSAKNVSDALNDRSASPTLSGLSTRLFDRLTQRQGVTTTEALQVLTSHGYNASASYGHMREAGATHTEALSVIALGSPATSLAYGQHRAAGYDHNAALLDAIIIGGDA